MLFSANEFRPTFLFLSTADIVSDRRVGLLESQVLLDPAALVESCKQQIQVLSNLLWYFQG